MDKILFIVPPAIVYSKFVHPPQNVRTVSKKDGYYGSVLTDMPLGVLALSAYVKKYTDAETRLLDFNVMLNRIETFEFQSFVEYFRWVLSSETYREFAPSIIGLSVLFTTSYQNMLDIARCCREIYPEVFLIAGGGVPTNLYREIFSETDCFDALIYGEGERALAGLVAARDKKNFLEKYPVCITSEKLENNLDFELDLIENLDEIPVYDYDLIDLWDYQLNPTIAAYPGVEWFAPHITIMTSRGCPFHCVFCSAHSIHGRKMRYYSLERVREDIAEIKRKFNIRTLVFQDDHFLASKDRALAIVNFLKENDITPFFPNSLTLYALTRPVLAALKSAGVRLLVMAIESGSERVLKEVMHKPLNRKIIRKVMQDCRELGLDTDVNIIVGLPGETKQDLDDARRFLKTIYGTWFRIYVAVPLVGSEMHRLCLERGYVKDGYKDGDFKKAVIETEHFSAEYIQHVAYSLNLDLNFVENSEMRLGNYARALKEFENTIRVKNDHAFAFYFAAKCYAALGRPDKYAEYKEKYYTIIHASHFWQSYVAEFELSELV